MPKCLRCGGNLHRRSIDNKHLICAKPVVPMRLAGYGIFDKEDGRMYGGLYETRRLAQRYATASSEVRALYQRKLDPDADAP